MEGRVMRVLIVGSGRMGRDAARLALGAGLRVTVASRDPERLSACLRSLDREVRRHRNAGGAGALQGILAGQDPEAAFDVILETVEEDLEAKRREMARWIPFAIPGGLLLSNSSSILPWEIHPAVLGFHLFYPSVICGFCEVVAPESVEDGLLGRLLSLSQRLGLHPLVQVGPARAFAVNRLFLPAQAWAVRRVLSGVSAAVVDEAFGRAWPGLRPLVFTESVGFTTTSRAVARYRSRMPEAVAADYGELEATIRELLTQGRTGFSSDGEPGAEGSEGASPEEVLDAEALFWNTCLWAREVGDLDDEELDTVLSGILDSRWPPPSLRASTEDLLTRCQQRWQETRLSWWRPASAPSGPSARGGVRERAGGSTEEGGG